jgi:hypothetical protein
VAAGGQVVVSVSSGGDDNVHRTQQHGEFDAARASEIFIDHPFGDVTIEAVDGDTVRWRLEAEFRGPQSDVERQAALQASAPDERIVLKTTLSAPPDGTFSARVQLHIEAPARLDTRCETANGTLVLRGLQARARLRNANGRVDVSQHHGALEVVALNGEVILQECDGETEVRQQHGSLRATGLNGALSASTQNGNVDIQHSRARLRLEVGTGQVRLDGIESSHIKALCNVTGNIEARMASAQYERIELRATTGNVRLTLAPDSGGHLSMGTGSGRLECQPILSDMQRSPQGLSGTLGPGSGDIVLGTTLGNIVVEQSASS